MVDVGERGPLEACIKCPVALLSAVYLELNLKNNSTFLDKNDFS